MRTWKSRFLELAQERQDEVHKLKRRLVDQQRDYEEQIHELHKEVILLKNNPPARGVIKNLQYIETDKEPS
jgi:tetrahydrodipicolinate N-succinyltransferase